MLMQIAPQYVQQKRRVVWADVARKRTKHQIKKTRKEPETRLRTLKRAHGKNVSNSPPCFPQTTRVCMSMSNSRKPQVPNSTVLGDQTAYRLLRIVFGSVTKADVRQKAGATHENAGELMPRAFADVLTIIGPITANDIFLDVGCGIGNIVAQFALQTPVRSGVQLRSDLWHLGCQLISRFSKVKPLLKKGILLQGDAKDGGLSLRPPFCDATIVYLNSFLFIDDVKALLLRELCALS
ncbi:histone H3-K79 methyltransferase [Phytophthora cactorum]|nr:histone H3-K79 methyltransferase [Phytophthora cactorum]